jgi:hypothetical protein
MKKLVIIIFMLIGIARAQYAGVIHSYFIDTVSNRFLNTTAITGSTNGFTYRYICLRFAKDLQGFSCSQYSTSNILNKFKAAYPFIGGTSTTCSYNFINPSINNLTFYNTPTFNSNGVTFDGTSQYAATSFYCSTLTNNNTHMDYYSRTSTTQTLNLDMGIFYYQSGGGSNFLFALVTPRTSGVSNGFSNSQATSTDWAAATGQSANRQGLWQVNRSGSAANTLTLNRNGSNIATASTNTFSGDLSGANFPILIGALNDLPVSPTVGQRSPNYYSATNCAFSSIGQGFTSTEITNEYNAVQAFNQRLGRSVGANIY